MAEPNYPVVPASRHSLAIPAGDVQPADWATVRPSATEPGYSGGVVTEGTDGVWGTATVFSSAFRLCVIPFARQALAGQQFSVRLLGFRRGVNEGRGTPDWLPVPLVELLCTLGTAEGVAGATDDLARYCSAVSVSDGSVGPEGEVLQFAATQEFPALALVELRGCERWRFDFKSPDAFPVNAFWARM